MRLFSFEYETKMFEFSDDFDFTHYKMVDNKRIMTYLKEMTGDSNI